jgi:hypothetical protein
MENTVNIIVYTGGTCGDLIGALIDPTNAKLTKTTITLDSMQTRLKKLSNFSNNNEKDIYLSNVKFKSVTSHDLEYHKLRDHKFISIVVEDFDLALWAATRFKNLHRTQVWKEMSKISGANNTNEYAQIILDYSNMVKSFAYFTINLKEIVEGTVLQQMQQIIEPSKKSEKIYKQWLLANKL